MKHSSMSKVSGIEERTPKNECVRDSFSSAKDARRVSRNVVEGDAILPSGFKRPPIYRSEGFFEPSFKASRRVEKHSILPPTRVKTSTIELEELETKTIVGHKNINGETTSFDTPEVNVLGKEGCSVNMDIGPLQISNRNTALANTKPFTDEEPIVIRRNLQRKISYLKATIFRIQKSNSTQKGKSLIQEYQLRSELEALCEDVFFLGEKKDRLAGTLLELQSKYTKTIVRNDKSSNDQEKDENGFDKTEEEEPTRFSDACVQTEDWPTTRIDTDSTLISR